MHTHAPHTKPSVDLYLFIVNTATENKWRHATYQRFINYHVYKYNYVDLLYIKKIDFFF